MLALSTPAILPDAAFKEKVRCGEVYRNLNGNEMFQKFYYRCLECSLDFESSPEFEEHVIAHYLQEDDDGTTVDNFKNNQNIIDLSSDDDDDDEDDGGDGVDVEEENGYLYAFEVASLVEENVSENDLPLPLMQMLSEQSADSCDQTAIQHYSESDEDEEKNIDVAFPCEGLRKQALHQYSEHCCTQCPAAYFSTKNELDFHLNIHLLQNNIRCPHCYEIFSSVSRLNQHIGQFKKKRIRKNEVKSKEIINEHECSHNSKKAKNQNPESVIHQEEGINHKSNVDMKEIVETFPEIINESEDKNSNTNKILSYCNDDK